MLTKSRAKSRVLRLSQLAVFTSALLSACAKTDGQPAPESALGLTKCKVDLDCGAGRYCQANLCTVDCVSSGDCALYNPDPSSPNNKTCSPCGRCIDKGAAHVTCLKATDLPCSSKETCVSALGADYDCDAKTNFCVKSCKSDATCATLGRGFSCVGEGAKSCQRTCFRASDCIFHGYKYACQLPSGVDPKANEEAFEPILGVCAKGDTVAGFKAASKTDPPSAAYQGIWGAIATSGVRVSGLPVITKVDELAVYRWLMKATWDGTNVNFQVKFCTSAIKAFDPDDFPPFEFFKVTHPDRNVDSISMNNLRFVAVPTLAADAKLVSDEMLDLRGAKLKNPLTDPLPTYKNPGDPTMWDQDRDGNPGMTVKVTGGFTGDLFQAQRWRTRATLRVVDRDKLEGLLSGPSDATILGATAAGLINDGVTTESTQKDRSWLRAVRLSDEASCADVISASETEGSFLAFAYRYPGGRSAESPIEGEVTDLPIKNSQIRPRSKAALEYADSIHAFPSKW